MQTKTSTVPSRRTSPRVVTVAGHGVRLKVWLHALWVEDGFKSDGEVRQRTLTRATAPLDRLLFLAGSGFVTVDALDWCATNGVPMVAVSQSGEPRWTLLPAASAGDAALRRTQALAPFTDTGAEIARWLIQRKVEGQRDVLRDLLARLNHAPRDAWPHTVAPGAAKALEALLPRIERAATIADVRKIEADAAATYWDAWTGLPLHFAPPSYQRTVPDHWRALTGRGSPLNNGNRNAADPANCLFNYAYALLEAEARIACHEAGLDPTLGILHTDTAARRSLVYDVMEPARPVADRLVLTLLLSHAFRPGELHLLRDGRCRLDQDLCARLWPWMPTFRQALGPVMTFLLGRLRKGPRYGERAAYRLVQVPPPAQTRAPLGQKRWAREAPAPELRTINACRSCGVLLDDVAPGRLYCDDCAPERRQELVTSAAVSARKTLRHLRETGRDPAHGGAAAQARGAAQRRAHRERTRWSTTTAEALRLPDETAREAFRRLLPRLRRVPLGRVAEALGISEGYASFVRRGVKVPHPRHWEALRTLAQRGDATPSPRGMIVGSAQASRMAARTTPGSEHGTHDRAVPGRT